VYWGKRDKEKEKDKVRKANTEKFYSLRPGDLIRFEHWKPKNGKKIVVEEKDKEDHGHSTIFLGFIIVRDSKPQVRETVAETDEVVGFQYFSSQPETHGLAVRSGYFDKSDCYGSVGNENPSDCIYIKNEIKSTIETKGTIWNEKSLIFGYMSHPSTWTNEHIQDAANARRTFWASENGKKDFLHFECPDVPTALRTTVADVVKAGSTVQSAHVLPYVKSLRPDEKNKLRQRLVSQGFVDSNGLSTNDAIAAASAKMLASEQKELPSLRRVPRD